MKLIITEDKLYKTFSKFMDKNFGLTYHIVKKKYLDVDANEYFFTTKDGQEIKVEYTLGYVEDKDGKLKINLQHSSLPY